MSGGRSTSIVSQICCVHVGIDKRRAGAAIGREKERGGGKVTHFTCPRCTLPVLWGTESVKGFHPAATFALKERAGLKATHLRKLWPMPPELPAPASPFPVVLSCRSDPPASTEVGVSALDVELALLSVR
jgi:hypothetical protein